MWWLLVWLVRDTNAVQFILIKSDLISSEFPSPLSPIVFIMGIADRIARKMREVAPEKPARKQTRSQTRDGFANQDRKRNAAIRTERQRNLHKAVLKFVEGQEEAIAELAAEHSVTYKHMRRLVYSLGGHIKTARKTNRWNAMKFAQKMYIDEGVFSAIISYELNSFKDRSRTWRNCLQTGT